MEFRNRTPFPAMAFDCLDQRDQRFHTLVMRLTFELQGRWHAYDHPCADSAGDDGRILWRGESFQRQAGVRFCAIQGAFRKPDDSAAKL
jgi:hypothetical protein